MVRAVLWDFGGVITTSPFEAFNRFERENGLPENFIRGVNSTNPDNNAWAKFERNDLDLAGFNTAFEAESRSAGHAIPGEQVVALLAGDVRPAMLAALRACRERFISACLTNNFAVGDSAGMTFSPERTEQVREAMALFHTVIESSKVGVRKPDPRIYRIVCDKLKVDPSDVVYLDDLGINLKPARAMGMTTIKVVDPDAALAELREVLGLSLG